jgi:uncharacterized protein YbaR (Trm112 family)
LGEQSLLNKKLLDILVCPYDKVTSLELLEFKTASNSYIQANETKEPDVNETVSTVSDFVVTPHSDSSLSSKTESSSQSELVKEGLLLCRTCLRFYPITDEIPIILPDELRDKGKDLEFIKKWKHRIPADLLTNLNPWRS